ncbi:hypothetical protein G3O08_02505 [Cryomorpha ignava]|uniref:Uncharacterized protein n=1 Tax=Cryomorpha ignava TaxID=101383 RepID=A0A7K3WND1_9FLAO|nr:hypothetical protein [Cryomorpha ignava]NEN22372.1 hypothetical protein [Cryomorpha ignava]
MGIELANKRLQSELDIDIEKLTTLTKNELQNYLYTRHLTPKHMESLADYLKVIGQSARDPNTGRARLFFVTAIELLDISDEVSKIMSFDRVRKKAEIENLIQQCE